MNLIHRNICCAMGTLSMLALMLTAGGCTADNSDLTPQKGERISFTVQTAASTRSVRQSEGNRALSLNGAKHPTYLVPLETEGIARCGRVTGLATRGVTVDGSKMESLGVYARRTDNTTGNPDYMYNVEVTREAEWTPADEYMWPGDCGLHFNAYSPYKAEGGTSGITRLPSADGPMTLDYIVPVAVEDQIDLLSSIPVDGDMSPCALTFNHALTGIRFAAGAELAPCKVKKIEITGVNGSGTLDLESGLWSNLTGVSSYSVSPDLSLAAAAGSAYVEAGTEITTPDQTMLLLPQTLSAEAGIRLTIEADGTETTLEASLESQKWTAGKTVTYRLSGNPSTDVLILDVQGDFESPYTGTTLPFTVSSYYSKSGTQTPVSWKAEFVDAEGNVTAVPSWIVSAPAAGSGTTTENLITGINDVVFHARSAETAHLQAAGDINASSGNTPYNLASASGTAAVENTANTYIINAPGKYSIPLVYGNAIKNGTDNKGSYTSSSSNRYALKIFENHLGKGITSPYIYENSGCTPASAGLIWEDQLNVVRNVALASDGKSLTFEIPANSIRQGNAIVAVRDEEGNVMWSWQIWITDFVPSRSLIELNTGSVIYNLWPENIGYVTSGDDVEFPAATALLRFTQTDVPSGHEPLVKTVTVTQTGKETVTPEGNTFYQWGRKDPIMADISLWYDGAHQEITSLPVQDGGSITDYPEWWIGHPSIMVIASHTDVLSHSNLWNPSLATSGGLKSIYDPCPAGYKVSDGMAFRYLGQNGVVTETAEGYTITLDGKVFGIFRSLGYRSSGTGAITGVGSRAETWYTRLNGSRTEGSCMVIESNRMNATATNPVFHAFSVRPVAE